MNMLVTDYISSRGSGNCIMGDDIITFCANVVGKKNVWDLTGVNF